MKVIRFYDETGRIGYGCEHADQTVTRLDGNIPDGFTDTRMEVKPQKILSPVAPAAIFGIGLNYHAHAEETKMELPRYPVVFAKNLAAVCHPGDPILLPRSCMDPPQVDYEAELAVVIGKPAKNVSEAEALNYVAGYTIANDVSARRWQKHAGAGQWVRGKSFDTFCPLGPRLITPEDMPYPQQVRIRCFLNQNLMQDSGKADMIYSVARLITYLSESTTLLPNTVILTGTPGGVGFVRKPPVYLAPGDTVEVDIEGIGRLINPVELEEL